MNKKEYLEIINKFKEINKELIESGQCRQSFLECLSKKGNSYNWKESIKQYIYFIYDDLEGWIEVKKWINKNDILVKYDNKEYKISKLNLQKCKLGILLGKHTKDFKIKIGTSYKDKKRDIIVIDKKIITKYKINMNNINEKWYKYHCNICNYEDWVRESSLEEKGCSCCNNFKAVLGINTIYDTDKWMIPYIGEEVAKKYTRGSGFKINPTCTDCGRVKNKEMKIGLIYKQHSIGCSCSDNVSYSEKIIFNMLEQLNINFQTQLTKTTFEWINAYRYDFYFEYNNEQYILEVNGLQHYENSFKNIKGARTLKEEQFNDKLKKELALSNNIKEENYIIIDCRYSVLEWIKNNILKSNLNNIFDLDKIDWKVCEEFTFSNLLKIICEIKRDFPDLSTSEIGKMMNMGRTTVLNYLKRGSKIWDWIDYNAKEELYNRSYKLGKLYGKPIICITTGHVFSSSAELERQSKELFGVKLLNGNVIYVCLGKRNHHHNFKFKYIKDLNLEEYIKYDIENKLNNLKIY